MIVPILKIVEVRSKDGLYQYEAIYRFGGGPLMGWVLLNPSGHDRAMQPTRVRCLQLARALGYGGIVQRNLFAYRATDPRELLTVDDPIGPENAAYLARAGMEPLTLAAWGANPIIAALRPPLPTAELFCLGINRDGSPRHPLHTRATRDLILWPGYPKRPSRTDCLS